MAQALDIYCGSYFQAVSLKAVFNARIPAATEAREVSTVLRDAADLLNTIAKPLLDGFELKKREPLPYIGYRPDTLFALQDAGTLASTPLPGDGAGMVEVWVGDGTAEQLQNISRAFNLAGMSEAARLAITVYTRMQRVSGQYGEVYLERGADKLPLKPSP